MTWPLDPMTLMWIQVATGTSGMLTLVYLYRILSKQLSDEPQTLIFFSPKGGCQEAIVQELKAAQSEILVQAYSFTADPLTFGLVDAKNRGINVEIVLDKSNELERYSDLHIFLENGVDVKIDHDHAIAHNKIIIIDQTTLITGSFNFTNQAEHENAENLLIIKGQPELIQRYRDNFFKHRDHAEPAVIREGVKDRRQHGTKAA